MRLRLVGPGGLAALFLGVCAVPAVAQEAAEPPLFETTEVADGVYQFRYMVHNNLFVVTPDGVIAFDPISEEAAPHYVAEIQRVAPGERLLALVYSHDHADHISGGPVLLGALGDAPIIAHENAYAKLAAAEDPARPTPTITVGKKGVLRMGGRAIELHYVGKTHSDNMLVAYLPDAKLAFAVDFVSHDGVGYRTLPDWHYPELYEAIERLQAIPYETIVFGHGPAGDRSSIDRQGQYYNDLRDAVQAAIDSGASKEETVAQIDLEQYRDWRAYDIWFSMNVDKMYDWLSGEGE